MLCSLCKIPNPHGASIHPCINGYHQLLGPRKWTSTNIQKGIATLEKNLATLLINIHVDCSLLVFQEFENKVKQWCEEAGEDVSYEFLQVAQYYWCSKAPGFLRGRQ